MPPMCLPNVIRRPSHCYNAHAVRPTLLRRGIGIWQAVLVRWICDQGLRWTPAAGGENGAPSQTVRVLSSRGRCQMADGVGACAAALLDSARGRPAGWMDQTVARSPEPVVPNFVCVLLEASDLPL